MAITKSTLVVSKASKPKNRKWDAKARFSTGHDTASKSLVPDELRLQEPKVKVGSYHSPTFGISREEREFEDVKHLLEIGAASNIDEAVATVRRALSIKRDNREVEVFRKQFRRREIV